MLNECGILKGRCEIYFHSFSLFFMDCTVMQRVVLIPRNIRGHLKLSSTNVEQPTRNPEKKKKRGKIGEYRIEIGRFRSGLGFYCCAYSLTH